MLPWQRVFTEQQSMPQEVLYLCHNNRSSCRPSNPLSGHAGTGLDLHEILSIVTTVRLYARAMVLFMSHSELLQLLGKKLFAHLYTLLMSLKSLCCLPFTCVLTQIVLQTDYTWYTYLTCPQNQKELKSILKSARNSPGGGSNPFSDKWSCSTVMNSCFFRAKEGSKTVDKCFWK